MTTKIKVSVKSVSSFVQHEMTVAQAYQWLKTHHGYTIRLKYGKVVYNKLVLEDGSYWGIRGKDEKLHLRGGQKVLLSQHSRRVYQE